MNAANHGSRRCAGCPGGPEWALVLGALLAFGDVRGAEISFVGMAAGDVLLVEVEDGEITPKIVGGEINGATFVPEDAGRVGNYSLVSSDDPRYRKGVAPLRVGRKARATNFVKSGEWAFEPRLTHWLYLYLPEPLQEGASYTLRLGRSVAGRDLTKTIRFDSGPLRSETIHLTQVGFLPGSPKFGFLSCWAGDAGALDLSGFEGKPFRIIDDKKKEAFVGKIALRRSAKETGDDAYKSNFQQCDVYEMDFSGLTESGRYILVVDGLGRSYPFVVSASAFDAAYKTAVRGLYYQRCGCPLQAEHAGSEWQRKRCHHPDDGKKVEATTLPLAETAMGGGGVDQFKELPKRATGENLDYWGGWHDAGDWDRRAQHMFAAAQLLDVYTIFPDAFGDRELNIPESGNGVPDIVDEALWCVGFFMRGQGEDGGVRGGIESEGHPEFDANSWKDKLHLYAYAPDARTSYIFAWCACKAARAMKEGAGGKHLVAAERAFAWAQANGGAEFRDRANAAAAELFALTNKGGYLRVFEETSVWSRNPEAPVEEHKKHDQAHGAFSHAMHVPAGRGNAELGERVRKAVLRQGDEWVRTAEQRAFRFAAHYWRPMSWGLGSAPDVQALIDAYGVSRDEKYADAIATSCSMTLGGNPLNMAWLSGLGEKRCRQVLHIDSFRVSDARGLDDVVPGLVPSGPTRFKGQSKGIHGFTQKSFYPAMKEWPILEQYAENRYDPSMSEHTCVMIGQAAAGYAFMHGLGERQPERSGDGHPKGRQSP